MPPQGGWPSTSLMASSLQFGRGGISRGGWPIQARFWLEWAFPKILSSPQKSPFPSGRLDALHFLHDGLRYGFAFAQELKHLSGYESGLRQNQVVSGAGNDFRFDLRSNSVELRDGRFGGVYLLVLSDQKQARHAEVLPPLVIERGWPIRSGQGKVAPGHLQVDGWPRSRRCCETWDHKTIFQRPQDPSNFDSAVVPD